MERARSLLQLAARHACTSAECWWNINCYPDRRTLISLNLDSARPNLFIEEPHRIKNFAKGCSFSRFVGLPEIEDAIVSQIPHDPRVGDSIVGQVA